MAGAADALKAGAPLRLVQSLAIGVELAVGWHTWHEVLHTGDSLALLLCVVGFVLGVLVTHAAALKSGAQAAVGSNLFWLSCTLSGGLVAIAQLRLRLQTANEDAFFVNALISSTLLGCSVPHAVRELLFSPSAEVLMPSVLAVLVTEALCSRDAFPQFQVLAGLFLLGGGLRGLILADASRLSVASESKPGLAAPAKAARAAERAAGPAKEKEPPPDPFFPATVLESQKYSPHFLVSRRRRCLGDADREDPLLQLVPRQAPENARSGKAKADAKRREKAALREPVPFDPRPGEAPLKNGDPTGQRRSSEASQISQISQTSQGGQDGPVLAEPSSQKASEEPAVTATAAEAGGSWDLLLQSAKSMVSDDLAAQPGDETEDQPQEQVEADVAERAAPTAAPAAPAEAAGLQAVGLNAAAAVFVPGAAAPPRYLEPVDLYAEPHKAFAAEPYPEAPFGVYPQMESGGMTGEVPYQHEVGPLHHEAMYHGMDVGGDSYDSFGGAAHDPFAYQDYSHMQAWSWSEGQPYAGDSLPSMGGFQHYATPFESGFQESGEDGSDESGRDPSRPTARPLDDMLPDPGAGRASEARRSAQDLRKEKGKGRGSSANSLLINGLNPADKELVRDLCAPFGAVEHVRVITDRDGAQSVMVEFVEQDSVEACLKGLRDRGDLWIRRPAAGEGRREQRRGSATRNEKGKAAGLAGPDTSGKGFERARDSTGKGATKGRGKGLSNWQLRQEPPLLAAEDAPVGELFWAYIDPKGGVQCGFTSAKMRGWYENGYFKEHLEVALLRDSQEKPMRADFRPLREWFPELSKSFISRPILR